MKKISLKTQLFILFWTFPVLYLGIMLYYPLKKFSYPIKEEIRIPEEHRQFIEASRKFEKSPKKKEYSIDSIKNPFYNETQGGPKLASIEPLQQTIRLTSVFNYEKKSCLINGKLYREGDKIGKIKILKIGDYYVEILSPMGKKIRLEVGAIYTFSFN